MKQVQNLPIVKVYHELVYVPPTKNQRLENSAESKGFVYCFAGLSTNALLNTKCYKYSVAEDIWSEIPNLVLQEHDTRLSNISVKTISTQSRYILLIRIDFAALYDTQQESWIQLNIESDFELEGSEC